MRLFRKSIAFIILIALIFGLCSCSAQWHLRKAKKKDSGLFKEHTVERIDTFMIETAKVDTVFKQLRDTVIRYVQKDNRGQEIKVKYIYKTIQDSVFIEVDCPDEREVIKTITKTETVEIEPSFWQKFKYSLAVITILIIIGVIKRLI